VSRYANNVIGMHEEAGSTINVGSSLVYNVPVTFLLT
jgi:hypothetical protein